MLFFIFSPEKTLAQRKADLGIFAGTSWYQGDINPSLPLYSPTVAAGLLYRYNFNMRTSARLSGIWHTLNGSDLDFNNAVQQNRAAEFNASYLDFSAVWEFNFLPYKTSYRKTKYSPYITAGLGYHLLLTSDISTNSHITIPFGMGFKGNISKRLSAGAECSFRKTYTDNLDGVRNYSPDDKYLLLGNKDWYTFAGIFLTYKIFNFREDCPAYD